MIGYIAGIKTKFICEAGNLLTVCWWKDNMGIILFEEWNKRIFQPFDLYIEDPDGNTRLKDIRLEAMPHPRTVVPFSFSNIEYI